MRCPLGRRRSLRVDVQRHLRRKRAAIAALVIAAILGSDFLVSGTLVLAGLSTDPALLPGSLFQTPIPDASPNHLGSTRGTSNTIASVTPSNDTRFDLLLVRSKIVPTGKRWRRLRACRGRLKPAVLCWRRRWHCKSSSQWGTCSRSDPSS